MNKKILTSLLTIGIIMILIIGGPASAVTVTMSGDATKELSTTSTLAVAHGSGTVDIEDLEMLNIQNYAIKITTEGGSELVYCLLDTDGNEVEGCDYIDNAAVAYNTDYAFGDINGYGYTTSGTEEGIDSGFGYGYGYQEGVVNEIVVDFDWEFQKQARTEGIYLVNVEAYAADGSEVKQYTSRNPKDLEIVSVSVNETITPSSAGGDIDVEIGGGNVTVHANVGYIPTADMGDVGTYLKGIVGVTGDINITLSLGEAIGDLTDDDVSTDPEDNIFMYIDIDGNIDPDLGYADIYFGVPKAMLDPIGGADVFSDMEVYIKHSDGTTQRLSLNREEDLDTATEYLFSVRVTKFSTFAVYNDANTSGGGSGGSGTSIPVSSGNVTVVQEPVYAINSTGRLFEIMPGDLIKFTTGGSEVHSMKLLALGDGYATITVASSSQSAVLKEGQSAEFEFSDGGSTLYVNLESVKDNSAVLRLRTAPFAAPETEPSAKEGTPLTGAAVKDTSNTGTVIAIILVALIVAAVTVFVLKKKK